MSHPRGHLIDWLRDAHAMEQQSERMLQGQVKRLERYPKLAQGLEQHLEQTRGQQRLLEEYLARLDASPSLVKDFAGRFSATAQTLAAMASADETIKGAMACYVFEQMEVAAYTSLSAAAHQASDIQCQHLCDRLLLEERAMADWLRGNLGQLTQGFLARDAAADRSETT